MGKLFRLCLSMNTALDENLTKTNKKQDPARAPRAPMWQPSTDSESPSFMKKMDMLFIQEKAARLLARRSRVQRQNQDLKGESIFVGEDYSLTEQNALKEVEMSALLASFEMDSDEEEVKLSAKREGWGAEFSVGAGAVFYSCLRSNDIKKVKVNSFLSKFTYAPWPLNRLSSRWWCQHDHASMHFNTFSKCPL